MILAVICFIQSAGSVLTYVNFGFGLCVLDLTTFLYFTLFGPLVYVVFLKKFFMLVKKFFTFNQKILIPYNLTNFKSKEQMIPHNYENSYSESINSVGSSLINPVSDSTIFPNNKNAYNSLKASGDLKNISYTDMNLNSNYHFTQDMKTEIIDSISTNNNCKNQKNYNFNQLQNEKLRSPTSPVKLIDNKLINESDDDKLISLENEEDYYFDNDDTKLIIAKSLSHC